MANSVFAIQNITIKKKSAGGKFSWKIKVQVRSDYGHSPVGLLIRLVNGTDDDPKADVTKPPYYATGRSKDESGAVLTAEHYLVVFSLPSAELPENSFIRIVVRDPALPAVKDITRKKQVKETP